MLRQTKQALKEKIYCDLTYQLEKFKKELNYTEIENERVITTGKIREETEEYTSKDTKQQICRINEYKELMETKINKIVQYPEVLLNKYILAALVTQSSYVNDQIY